MLRISPYLNRLVLVSMFLAGVFAVAAGPAKAGIRDAEIEEILALYTGPIFQAAGLRPDSIDVTVLANLQLNAFVADGQRVFLNTGIILATKTPNELIGVIAHETGHISGGHLARGRLAIDQARIPLILSTLAGLGAAVAGAGDAGVAIIAGGSQVGTRNFLQFTRIQESAADQAAADYLDATGQSAGGLVSVLETISDQNVLSRTLDNSYAQTHPLGRERIAALRRHLAQSPHSQKSDNADLQLRHDRMRAKLAGFLDEPGNVLHQYPVDDTSIPARYARAATYHRMGDPNMALLEIDSLISELPNDPYFHEIKGQILYESGRNAEAITAYRQAVQLAPGQELIQLALGQALVASGEVSKIGEGVAILEIATHREREYPIAWRSLAIGYQELGETGKAQLATAERLAILGRYEDARIHADRALTRLPDGSPGWIRANDISALGARSAAKGNN